MTHLHRLEAEGLTLGYGERVVVHDLTLRVPDAAVTVVIGPNACGKSTLLRGLGRLRTPRGGTVRLDGRPLTDWPTREIARVLGILPQQPIAPDGITVADIVCRGRTPHRGLLRRWSTADADAVARVVGTEFIAAVSPPTALSLTWGFDDLLRTLSTASDKAA